MAVETVGRQTHPDTIVVGSGPAGAAVAARIAAGSDRNVLLLEAGPDYGAYGAGRWPTELLDYTAMPVTSHSWDYRSSCPVGTPDLPLDRARVIGGCSSHNGCAAVWGHLDDYDAWANLGNPGWDTASLMPFFEAASSALRVFQPTEDEITPWHRACFEAGPDAGLPQVDNINQFDLDLGIGIGALNVSQGVRWNSAFGYLDPIRDLANLSIQGDSLVDKVIFEGDRAIAVDIVTSRGQERIQAAEIILCAGAYGSPLILIRSGVGDPREMKPFGIRTIHELQGVGRNLQDHTSSHVEFGGTNHLVRAMDEFVAAGGAPREEGTIVLAQSSRCRSAFDLHLYPIGSRKPDGSWRFAIYSAIMTPQSRGTISLSGTSPEASPVIDHQYFGDAEGRDLDVLAEGIEFARALASSEPLRALAGTEIGVMSTRLDPAAIKDQLRATASHDYHPAGSCKMGPSSDPTAVVDHRGQVHGLSGLYVADASIMPIVPRANTNIPTAVVGERIAAFLLDS